MHFQQLAALLITRQVIGNLREAVIPFILWKLKLIKVGYDITAHMSPSSIENEIKNIEREIIGVNQDKEKVSDKNDEKPMAEENYDTLEREIIPGGLTHRRGSEAVVLPREVTEESNTRSRMDSLQNRQTEAVPSILRSRIDSLQDRQADEMKRQCSALILTQAEMESTMTKVSTVMF